MKTINQLRSFALNREEMRFIFGRDGEVGEGGGGTCSVTHCPGVTVTCAGFCTAENHCAWCNADKEGTKKCCGV